jgi:hypothetical protein
LGVLAACVVVFSAGPVVGQQSSPQPVAANEPRTATDHQQPGAGAQVHTGTSSGLEGEARLQNLLADHQFLALESQLDKLPAQLSQLYRGILDNRENDLQHSIELLEPLEEKVTSSGNTYQEKLLRKALAEDYLRQGDWKKAAIAYQTLYTRLQDKLSPDEQDEIELPLKLLPLAQANAAMTVEPCDPFRLQVSRDPLGITDIPVYVDARPQTWMLDPTAPFNLISRSRAKQAGLKVSLEAATIHTLTGRPIQVHVTVIPRFTVGGRLTLRNMTVFVFEDADYYFPQTKYQVEGVLGYPALSAMGRLTVTADATIEVRPAKQILPPEKDDLLTQGARFFFDGDQVIVALNKSLNPGDGSLSLEPKPGDERMFVVDAAGQQTYLTARYYDEHTSEFADQKMELFAIPGAQPVAPQPAYSAETIPLAVGPTTVNVHYVPVLTQPLRSAALDDVYGVLGVDVLDQLKSYTFDYRTMRFEVRPE